MLIHNIPIINYHKISTSYDIGITTRHPEQFENDLKILKQHNFKSVTFKDLLNKAIPENPVIITFDDAYESIINTAMPLMLKYGFKAVIYAITGFIGQYNDWDVQAGVFKFKHLNLQQLRELQDVGFEIGSHTLSHQLLTWMHPDDQLFELSESKKQLDDQLGDETCSVSYPFGRFNETSIRYAAEIGYKFGVASIYLRPIEINLQKFALKRFNIYRFDSIDQLKKKLFLKQNSSIVWRDWLIQKGGLGTATLQMFKKKFHNNGRGATI